MRTISAIALCLMLVFATTGCAASKIAVVDPARLFQESEPGKAGIEHLKQLEAAMQEPKIRGSPPSIPAEMMGPMNEKLVPWMQSSPVPSPPNLRHWINVDMPDANSAIETR